MSYEHSVIDHVNIRVLFQIMIPISLPNYSTKQFFFIWRYRERGKNDMTLAKMWNANGWWQVRDDVTMTSHVERAWLLVEHGAARQTVAQKPAYIGRDYARTVGQFEFLQTGQLTQTGHARRRQQITACKTVYAHRSIGKMGTDMLLTITRAADEHSGAINIDDLERPWNFKIESFSTFCDFTPQCTF